MDMGVVMNIVGVSTPVWETETECRTSSVCNHCRILFYCVMSPECDASCDRDRGRCNLGKARVTWPVKQLPPLSHTEIMAAAPGSRSGSLNTVVFEALQLFSQSQPK